MRQDFTQHLIHLRRLGLATQPFAKARLDHAERRLTVRPLVIMPHIFFAVQTVIVKNSIPSRTRRVAARVRAKSDVRLSADTLNEFEVSTVSISLIATDFTEIKSARCVSDKRLEIVSIVRIPIGDFNRRDYMSSHADHRMKFQPVVR